jgi:hypothetical protein
MSTSVPVSPQSQPYIPPKGVTLDMSTSVPITSPDQPGIVSRAVSGAWQGAKDLAAPVINSVKPPADPTEQVLHSAAGEPGLAAYRAAKQVMGTANAVVKAGAQEYPQAISDWRNAVDEFHKGNYRNAATSAGELGTDVFGIVTPMAAPLAQDTRRLVESTRPGGDFAGEFSRQAVQAAPAAILIRNPFRAAAPEAAAGSDVAATSKIEPAVAARTAKAGLAPGEAGLSEAEAAEKTTQSALEARTATQENVNRAIQNVAARHAAENGLPAPTAGTAIRDVITNSGDALVDAGKADYGVVDKFTNGKFTNAQNELKNAQLELRQKAGLTGVDTGGLEANVIRAQMNVDNLFDSAVENGMPKTAADTARSKFRTGQATLDAGNDVRMANKVRGPAGERTTDLNVLENRWQARYDSGRLQQAFGEQGAKDALTEIHGAREIGELFESLPATESQALKALIQKNTVTGKFGTTTDWVKVRDNFSDLPNRGAQFSDVPKVEKFINNQVFYQRLRKGAVGVAATIGAGALAAKGYELAH